MYSYLAILHRLTPYASRLTLMLFLLVLSTGCSNIIRSGLMNSNTVFLDPSMNRTAYLQIRNTSENQNITLSVPREVLKRVKRIAADRDTSVSALMTEALARLADEDRRYSAARKRALAAMKSARSLGTRGRRTWTRDELHER